MPGFNCRCCNTCTVVRDNFNRVESLGNVNVPNTILWDWISVDGGGGASANGTEAQIAASPSHLTLKPVLTDGGVPRQFKVSFRVKLGEDEKTFRLKYSLILATTTENEIDVELVTSDGMGGCGIMRMLLDSVAVTEDIPVVGLDKDVWHTVDFCYSGEQALASLTVTPEGGEAQACHAKNVATTAGTADNTSQLSWINVDSSDLLLVDDMRLSRTKTLEDGDYGDQDLECPCCGGGCGNDHDLFDGEEIDCRWLEYAGGWDASNSGDPLTLGTVSTINSNARLLWLPNGNGIDSDCLPDNSIRMVVDFYVTEFFVGELLVIFDWLDFGAYHFIKIDPTSGVISINSSTDGMLASESFTPIAGNVLSSVTFCYDGTTISVVSGAWDAFEADSEPFGGGVYGLGTGALSAAEAHFSQLVANRNIYHLQCSDCGFVEPCENGFCSDETPHHLLFTIITDEEIPDGEDIGDLTGFEECEEVPCDDIRRSFLLQRDPDFDELGNCGCYYRGYFDALPDESVFSETPDPREVVLCTIEELPPFNTYQRISFVITHAFLEVDDDDERLFEVGGAYITVFEDTLGHFHMGVLKAVIWRGSLIDADLACADLALDMELAEVSCLGSETDANFYCDLSATRGLLEVP